MLPTLGGDYASGSGINDRGEVTGTIENSSNERHAFLWSTDGIVDLGTFGGSASYGSDINNIGQVVGFFKNNADENRAFLYTDGGMRQLGTLGGNWSSAEAINNAGQIIGRSNLVHGGREYSSFLYEDGKMYDLCKLTNCYVEGWTSIRVSDINDQGDISGTGRKANSDHAFIISPVSH